MHHSLVQALYTFTQKVDEGPKGQQRQHRGQHPQQPAAHVPSLSGAGTVEHGRFGSVLDLKRKGDG